MKFKIMIMALLLLAGIGSAANRLPATEFVGDVDMGENSIVDVSNVTGNHGLISPDVYVYIDGTDVIARYRNGTILSSGTNEVDNTAVINAAIGTLTTFSQSVKVTGYHKLSGPININVNNMHFDATGAGFRPIDTDTDLFNITTNDCTVDIGRIYGAHKSGTRGIVLNGGSTCVINVNLIHFIEDGIVLEGPNPTLDNDITFNMIGGCEHGISMIGDDIEGTRITGNFITGCNYSIYMNSSNVNHFNYIDIIAIDSIGWNGGKGAYGVYATGSGGMNVIAIRGFWSEATIRDLYDDMGGNHFITPPTTRLLNSATTTVALDSFMENVVDATKYITGDGIFLWKRDNTDSSGPKIDFWAATSTPIDEAPVASIQGHRVAPGAQGNLIFSTRFYDGSVGTLIEAMRLDQYQNAAFAKSVYITDVCSALEFVDRTPGYTGDDALADIRQIRNTPDDEIDHSTLPEFIQNTYMEDGKEMDGRDMGNSITLLFAAVQQLDQENQELKKEVAEMKKVIGQT